MEPWEPEHGVDADFARRLIAATWSDVDLDGEVEHVGSGWDVDVWRVGALAVRFPRRALGVACVENELVALPAVAAGGELPIAMPIPLRIGEPVLGFPARFYAHAWLPGIPLLRSQLDDVALARLAAPLGGFLRALHARPIAPLRAAGVRDDARGDSTKVAERGRMWLAKLALPADLARDVRTVIETPVELDAEPVLLHGDFHPGNLLVQTEPAAVTGVVDWGDCAIGDRANDLAIGWSSIPAAARAEFLAAYGDVSPATWARARLIAAQRHGLALLGWGEGLGDATIVEWARRSLARIV